MEKSVDLLVSGLRLYRDLSLGLYIWMGEGVPSSISIQCTVD